jgi:hypothetical protein
MLVPTDIAAIASRMIRKSAESSLNAGIMSNAEKIKPTTTATTCPPITR